MDSAHQLWLPHDVDQAAGCSRAITRFVADSNRSKQREQRNRAPVSLFSPLPPVQNVLKVTDGISRLILSDELRRRRDRVRNAATNWRGLHGFVSPAKNREAGASRRPLEIT